VGVNREACAKYKRALNKLLRCPYRLARRRTNVAPRPVQRAAGGVFLGSGTKFAYEFWHDHLRPLGFHLKVEVLEYPGGMPGDIGLILAWE